MLYSSSRRRNAAIFFALVASPSFVRGICEDLPFGWTCAPGCWNEGGQFTIDGLRVCSPVGPSYYGPIHSNERFPCQPGTASDDPEAVECKPCEPGSMAPLQRLPQCIACPPGYFQDKFGGKTCLPCSPGYYGQGSVGITTGGFCIGGEEPSPSPSNQPSSRPSIAPSASPSTTPTQSPSTSPSKEPSPGPSQAPSLAPSRTSRSVPSTAPSVLSLEPSNFPSEIIKVAEDLNYEDGVCIDDEFVLHRQCTQCPSVLRSAVLTGLLAVCILVLAIYFFLTAPFGTAVLFIGVEFYQLLSLVGINHVQWPKIMDVVFSFAAIIGLDIDIIAPIQCHLGLSPQVNHFIVMLLPVLFVAFSIGCVSVWHEIRKKRTEEDLRANFDSVARLLMLGLVFGYMKLVVTSLEAISCSFVQVENDENGFVDLKIDWFCLGKGSGPNKIIAFHGLVAFFVYGLGLPVVLCIVLRRYRDPIRTGTEVPSVLAEVSRVFLLTYRDDRWWWTVFVLARKLVFVLVVSFFPDLPVLSHVFIVIVTAVSAAMQWRESPYYEDTAEDAEGGDTVTVRSFSLLRHQTVDLILHGSLIAIAILGILFNFITTTSDSRVGLGLIGIIVMVASMLLLVAAAFRACMNRFSAETFTDKTSSESVLDLERGTSEDEAIQ